MLIYAYFFFISENKDFYQTLYLFLSILVTNSHFNYKKCEIEENLGLDQKELTC
jgi:hypothetical protein